MVESIPDKRLTNPRRVSSMRQHAGLDVLYANKLRHGPQRRSQCKEGTSALHHGHQLTYVGFEMLNSALRQVSMAVWLFLETDDTAVPECSG